MIFHDRVHVLLLLLLTTCSLTIKVRDDNPLVSRLDEEFPPWEDIEAHHVQPAITQHLLEANSDFKKFEATLGKTGFQPTPENLLEPYRLLGERLNKAYSYVSHLKSVRDSPELRAAIDNVRPKIQEFYDVVSHSKPIYNAFKDLRENDDLLTDFSPAQKRVVDQELQNFELDGVGLEGKEKEELTNISLELANLSSTFSNNVLDSTNAWKKTIQDKNALTGIPETVLQIAAQAFQLDRASTSNLKTGDANGEQYLFKLDAPTISAVLTYAENAELRREMYLAYISGSSDLRGPDNEPVLKKILSLRQKKAQLLNFPNYAELSMQKKMATLNSSDHLLEELRTIAYPKAKEDLAALRKFAVEEGHVNVEDLKPWDLSYWSHKQLIKLFGIDPEELRPYFPLQQCLEGLFSLAQEMFNVQIKEATGPTWHKDVLFFAVYRGNDMQSPIAHLYLDLFSRPSEKRSGAWQMGLSDYDSVRGKKPLATIVANMRPPAANESALLSFDELHTLFHEFGHSLQHMLTTQKEPALSGLQGVEWDAVELASQFMEYWLDEVDWVVKRIAKHHKTGEPIPMDKLTKLRASAKHQAGMSMLRQLRLSFVDLDVHTHPIMSNETATQRETDVATRRQTLLMPKLPEDRFLNQFSHIFAGGYSAGYYSYKWAEVLSADAFSRFQEEGATEDSTQSQAKRKSVGSEFAQTVLGEGGGRSASEVFQSFRLRAPSTDALIKYSFPTN